MANQISIVGTLAPEFDLPCTAAPGSTRRRAALSEFRGKWLVLVFYPRDFSLLCPTELTALSARLDEFHQCGAEVLGISVDSIESHERWLATPKAQGGVAGLNFALASDEDGAVSRAYGVFLEQQHLALRGLFVIDPNGVLQYKTVHNLAVGRRSDDIIRVLSALHTGGLCAEDWTPGLATIDPTRALGPGSVVSHYRIEEYIGAGSFACVFRAHDTTLQRTVALKVIKPDSPLTLSAVLDEARSVAALNHPNICTVYAVDDSEGIPIIAMEYVPGRPLSKVLQGSALEPKDAASIGCQIASGMAAAHALGLCHGDLKPANVILRDDGVDKILDFGLARREGRIDPKATVIRGGRMTDSIKGTPAYMSPEQASGGSASPAGDVFSLGLILYEMLTGREAFCGDNIPQLLKQIRAVEPKRFAADVSEPFASILSQALVCDLPSRQITMQQIAQRLK